jgi:hypothetical protein
VDFSRLPVVSSGLGLSLREPCLRERAHGEARWSVPLPLRCSHARHDFVVNRLGERFLPHTVAGGGVAPLPVDIAERDPELGATRIDRTGLPPVPWLRPVEAEKIDYAIALCDTFRES